MSQTVFVYDPTASDELSKVRGIGRYMQILQENFPEWKFRNDLRYTLHVTRPTTFINPFINFLQRPVVTRRIADKQIALIHDLIPLKYPAHFPAGLRGKLNIFTNKVALKNYDAIIAISQTTKEDIVKILGISPEKITVIYSGLPRRFAHLKTLHATRYTLHATHPYCLYVGDATWNKNIVNLAKAIKIADVPCVFVGKVFTPLKFSTSSNNNVSTNDTSYSSSEVKRSREASGWLKDFNDFSELAKGDPRFIFPGYVADDELLTLYQNAVCNVLVSRDEGFGYSYLEAASQGCPSVLSDIPIFHETAKGSALYANPTNPEDIAAKIKLLYSDDTVRLKLQKKAKTRADFFSADQFKKVFLKVIS